MNNVVRRPLITYSLYDKIDCQFLTVKHPTCKSAAEHLHGYINNHNIAIIEVIGNKVRRQMHRFGHYPLKPEKTEVDLALAKSRYLPQEMLWQPIEPVVQPSDTK